MKFAFVLEDNTMTNEELLKRINELAHKQKTIGLNDIEIKEQEQLRKEYLINFRKGLRQVLDNTYIEDPSGKHKLKRKDELS